MNIQTPEMTLTLSGSILSQAQNCSRPNDPIMEPQSEQTSSFLRIQLFRRRLSKKSVKAYATIAGFHCHAIKIKIENHSMNEVKKFTRYRR